MGNSLAVCVFYGIGFPDPETVEVKPQLTAEACEKLRELGWDDDAMDEWREGIEKLCPGIVSVLTGVNDDITFHLAVAETLRSDTDIIELHYGDHPKSAVDPTWVTKLAEAWGYIDWVVHDWDRGPDQYRPAKPHELPELMVRWWAGASWW